MFDGLWPHVSGAGLGSFNHRFASPARHAGQHDHHLYPVDRFPFAYEDERDPFTGRTDSLLARARASGVVPRIFHTQSASEYWHRSGSLVHTDPLGIRDSTVPPEVRIYIFGGTQHGSGSGVPGEPGRGQLADCPSDYRPFLRALLVALEEWVEDGREPPPSVYPHLADGTLTGWRAGESGWLPLPGVRYPQVIQRPERLDRGPEFEALGRASIEPPVSLGRYAVRAPAHGPDDNELGMLLLPPVAAPLGTFTGWNLRSRALGAEDELLGLTGGYIPFARTAEERRSSGDPRPSLEERYRGFEDYREKFEAHARRLAADRYLLEEDLPRLAALAGRFRGLFER